MERVRDMLADKMSSSNWLVRAFLAEFIGTFFLVVSRFFLLKFKTKVLVAINFHIPKNLCYQAMIISLQKK